jgi:NADH:ubiquinone oxidoreductase subunit 5 (subunit L)/multisubunit Na+/H+ antiporter MnhA subunit
MEILFYITIFSPLILGLLALFFDKDTAKSYLNFSVTGYFILSVIVVYLILTNNVIDSISFLHLDKVIYSNNFFILDTFNMIFYSIIILLSFLI